MKINTTKPHVPIWLVWSESVSGNNVLNAIALDNEIANKYRDALKGDRQYIRTWIEPTLANHLYASMFELRSDDEIRRIAQQIADAKTARS